jgi:hypothetical protein
MNNLMNIIKGLEEGLKEDNTKKTDIDKVAETIKSMNQQKDNIKVNGVMRFLKKNTDETE